VALVDLPRELSATQCGLLAQCFGAFETLSMQDCVDELEPRFRNGGFVAIQSAIESKRVSYDAKKARACLDAIEKQGCDSLSTRNPSVCDDALSGSVPLGNACSIDAECAGNAHCDWGSGTCPGVCAAPHTDGQSCVADGDCADSLICQGLGAAGSVGQCRAPATGGQVCLGTTGPECRPELVCLGGTATASGTCAAIDIVASGKLGEACDLTAQKLCRAGLSCAVQTVTPSLTFSCIAKLASGAPCTLAIPDPCQDDEICTATQNAPTTGTCTPMPKLDEACTTAIPCNGDLVCIAGKCAALKDTGATCASDAECYSGDCPNSVCVGGAFCTQ
jgi:hypothetical protein